MQRNLVLLLCEAAQLDGGHATGLIGDAAARPANRAQFTTDGHRAYLDALEGAFGAGIDYATLIKLNGAVPAPTRRRKPGPCIGTNIGRVEGRHDPAHVSTSYAEREKLTESMQIQRFTRLNSPSSKGAEAHYDMVALYAVWYNFVRIHMALRCSPAEAAGLNNRPWDMADAVELIDTAAAAPKPRGPYEPCPPKAKAVSN